MNLKWKTVNKAGYYILLISILVILIILHLCSNIKSIYIDLYGDRIKANEEILIEENKEYYLSFKYIKDNIDQEIYFDNISKKVVISSYSGLYKIKINDKNINVNFEDKQLNNKGVIENKDKYISLEVLKEAYGLNSSISGRTIYLYGNNIGDGKTKYNNASVYVDNNLKSKIVNYVDKKDKIKVIFEKEPFVFVRINNKEVGYVLGNALKYKVKSQEDKQGEKQNQIYIFADGNSMTLKKDLPISNIIIDMFDVTQVSTKVNTKNINKNFLSSLRNNEYKIYGKIGNGYELAGFNTNTMSQILADESKRINLINNINDKIKEYSLAGIVLDFRKLKEKDGENYIQFVKELKAFVKIEVVVNIDSSEYKIYLPVINYTDFSIVNVYGQRDLKSTVSGSVSEIKWMKEILNSCLNEVQNEKIVVGIPAYTILWTEKNSNVVDSEIYNLKATEEYVAKNKLELKEVNGQKYTQLEKGSLIYRMWLEDEFSIKNRLEIIKENKLKGIAIYKLGYENDTLINILKNNN